MHRPWAGSNKNHSFGAQYHSRLGRPSQSIHPHYLSAYASTSELPHTLQCSILGPWLAVTQTGFAPVRLQTISSPHVHHMVRRNLKRRTSDQCPMPFTKSIERLPGRKSFRTGAVSDGNHSSSLFLSVKVMYVITTINQCIPPVSKIAHVTPIHEIQRNVLRNGIAITMNREPTMGTGEIHLYSSLTPP